MKNGSLTINVIRSWDDVWSKSFQQVWLKFYNSCGSLNHSPFTHPSVVRAWTQTFNKHQHYDPYFILVEKENTTVAIFPMVLMRPRWQRGFLSRLTPIGERYFDYHDPMISAARLESDSLDLVWRLFLAKIQQDYGRVFDTYSLPRYRRTNNFSNWNVTDRAPVLRVSNYSAIDEYLASRKKSLRIDVRRQLKRARALGALSFLDSQSSSLEQQLSWAGEITKNRNARYPESSLPPRYLENLVTESFSGNGPVHLSAVCLDDQPISWHIGFETKWCHYWYIPTFNPDYSSISAGKLHVYFAIERAIQKKLLNFDFLRGLESYKSGWTDGEIYEPVGVFRGPSTLSGHGKSCLADGLNFVNRVVRRIKE